MLILDGQQRILSLYYLCRQKVFSQYHVRERFHQITEARHNQLIDFDRFLIGTDKKKPILEYPREKTGEFNFKKFQRLLGSSYKFPVVIVSLDDFRKAIEVLNECCGNGDRRTESPFHMVSIQ
jgi:uncharacterized protein with ParB-like and HNH nuclease domain